MIAREDIRREELADRRAEGLGRGLVTARTEQIFRNRGHGQLSRAERSNWLTVRREPGTRRRQLTRAQPTLLHHPWEVRTSLVPAERTSRSTRHRTLCGFGAPVAPASCNAPSRTPRHTHCRNCLSVSAGT